jgi:hypothetical protein
MHKVLTIAASPSMKGWEMPAALKVRLTDLAAGVGSKGIKRKAEPKPDEAGDPPAMPSSSSSSAAVAAAAGAATVSSVVKQEKANDGDALAQPKRRAKAQPSGASALASSSSRGSRGKKP